MALTVWVETVIKRTNQASVNYLIEDDTDGSVRFVPALLRGEDMDDPAAYGEANASGLFSRGKVVIDGIVRIEKVRDGGVRDLHDEALLMIRKMVLDGETLADILTAVLELYDDQPRVLEFMTNVYLVFNAGTAAQQRQFTVLMLYLLTARG